MNIGLNNIGMMKRVGGQVKRGKQNSNTNTGQNKKRNTSRDVSKDVDDEKENNDPPVQQNPMRMVCISLFVCL